MLFLSARRVAAMSGQVWGNDMGATISDVAKKAGVGLATVSRALNGVGYVSPDTRERILKAASELKYRHNRLASGLAAGRTKLIGVLAAPDLISTFRSTIGPIEIAIREAGYSMLLYTSTESSEGERICLEQLMQNRVAGVAAFPGSTLKHPGIYRELLDSGIKLVVIGWHFKRLPTLQIRSNDYEITYKATQHLLSLGHKRIVYLSMPLSAIAGEEREKGFRDALKEAGVPKELSPTIEIEFSEESAAAAVSQLMKFKNPPTAIIARHDMIARGVMRKLASLGLSIPGDVSIVGTGDIPDNDMLFTPLTTVRLPILQMAQTGIQRLLSFLAGETVKTENIVMDVELIVRASTAPPRCVAI